MPTQDGSQPWVSDGTAEGTYPLEDHPWIGDGAIVANGQRLYFTSMRAAEGHELWSTDGTAGGAELVADLNPGPASSFPTSLTPADDSLLFLARTPFGGSGEEVSGQLWRLEGDDLTLLVPEGGVSALTLTDGATLFTRPDECAAVCPPRGRLWRTDGTPEGSRPVTGEQRVVGDVAWLTAFRDGALFSANDGRHGKELWRTDGTDSGTVMVADIFAQTSDANPESLVVSGERLFFVADDGLHGRQLWVSDGTAGGTIRLTTLDAVLEGAPENLALLGGRLYFTVAKGPRGGLWSTDGTGAGTELHLGSLVDVARTAVGGGYLFLLARGPASTWRLWRTDGTAGGTILLADFPDDHEPRLLTGVADGLFFTAASAAHGRELWWSDGSPEGTNMMEDLTPGAVGSEIAYIAPFGSRVWLLRGTCSSSSGPRQDVYVADASGVTLVHASACAGLRAAVAGDEIVYFSIGVDGRSSLWSSDGTREGSREILTLPSGARGSDPVQVGERIVYLRRSADQDLTVWSMDVRGGGAEQIGHIPKRLFGALSGPIGVRHGRVYYSIVHQEQSVFTGVWIPEVWSSDGTEHGTRVLFQPVYRPRTSSAIVLGSDLLFFAGYGETSGTELWAAPLDDGANCRGDCDEDGTTSLEEVLAAIRRALGDTSAPCAVLDRVGRVTIDRLVAAVRAQRAGCG